jgi:hypothetical protein
MSILNAFLKRFNSSFQETGSGPNSSYQVELMWRSRWGVAKMIYVCGEIAFDLQIVYGLYSCGIVTSVLSQ